MNREEMCEAVHELYRWVNDQSDSEDRLPTNVPTQEMFYRCKGMVVAYNNVWNHMRMLFSFLGE